MQLKLEKKLQYGNTFWVLSSSPPPPFIFPCSFVKTLRACRRYSVNWGAAQIGKWWLRKRTKIRAFFVISFCTLYLNYSLIECLNEAISIIILSTFLVPSLLTLEGSCWCYPAYINDFLTIHEQFHLWGEFDLVWGEGVNLGAKWKYISVWKSYSHWHYKMKIVSIEN